MSESLAEPGSVSTGATERRAVASHHAVNALQRGTIYIVLIVASIAFLFPLFWMASTSLKAKEQIMAMPPQMIPNPVTWSNYPTAMTAPGFDFPVLLKNTLFYAVIETFGIIIRIPVAYSFAACAGQAISSSSSRWPAR
jgi:ABC-type glycerol-3-phosphate transport system permease component